MTEPLGQSQVIPYLAGLTDQGVDVELLSFEPAGTPRDVVCSVSEQLCAAGIRWSPLVRSPSHGVARKCWEVTMASMRGLAMALARRPDVVHARSYLPAAAADAIATLVPGASMLFDLRGMLGDEYVDGGNWRRESLRYRVLKKYERRLLQRADGLVVLTRTLEEHLRSTNQVRSSTPLEVIPCCVDTNRFTIDLDARRRTRSALGIGDRPLIVYSGTLGSWYMAREMAALVGAVRRWRPDVALLLLSHADTAQFTELARAAGLGAGDLFVRKTRPTDMPALLAAGDVGLSFIRPCFSKLGSSPTKVAEYLACGLAAIVNEGVGDMGELASAESCIVAPRALDDAAVAHAARAVCAVLDVPHAVRSARAREVAVARFSLSQIGVPRYTRLYRAMSSAPEAVLRARASSAQPGFSGSYARARKT